MKNNKLLTATIIGALAISAMGSIAFAATSNISEQGFAQSFEKDDKPARPENEVLGKITAITADSVTISLAERKMPDGLKMTGEGARLATPPEIGNSGRGFANGERPEPPANANGERPELPANANGERPEPPTNTNGERPELPTNANGEMPEKINPDNMFTLTGETKTYDISSASFDDFRKKDFSNDQNTDNNTNETKTYKDYSVGDYIAVETESSTSTKAKSVRSAMRGGMGPRGGMGGPKGNKGTNTTNNQQ